MLRPTPLPRFAVTAHRLPYLAELEKLIAAGGAHVESRVLCEVTCLGQRLPIHVVSIGNAAPEVPAIGFFGGFHGLERIGAEVVLAYLQSLTTRLNWDRTLHALLESVRLIFVPLVNPGGILQGTRANPNGIDLMRNAPLESQEQVPYLLGGQRLSPRLPWYRGEAGQPMEVENRAIQELVVSELLAHKFSMSVDCHSGFGASDRIWFPYAHTRAPIAHLAEMHALKDLMRNTMCNYNYIFEPQSSQYLTHGDLWDHLYLFSQQQADRVFLPLTLEMGSWIWVKKNPRQLFTRHGIFNPLIEHRRQRVLRRHLPLLDFFTRAACSHAHWMPEDGERGQHRQHALASWYPERGG